MGSLSLRDGTVKRSPRVVLDDESLLHLGINLVSGRNGDNGAAHGVGFDLEPGGEAPCSGTGDSGDEGREAAASLSHRDGVPGAHPVGGDVHAAVVDGEVAMADELTRLGSGAGESQAPDDVVEATLEELEESLSGDAGATCGFGEVAAELTLEQAVDSTELLLFAELEAVVGDSATHPSLGALARRVRALLDSALARSAAVALEV